MLKPIPVPKIKYRINTTSKIFIITVAAFFDFFQLLIGLLVVVPILGAIVDAIAAPVVACLGYSVIWLWLRMKGVPIFEGRYLGRKATLLPLTFIAELIPFINNLLPTITLWAWITIQISRKEDKEEHAKIVAKVRAQNTQRLRAQRNMQTSSYDDVTQ